MTIYEKVKSAVPVREAAERYGLESDRRGMARCPFHDDRHPSMKLNEDYFYCFGCGEHGDVIALTAGLLGLRPGEAARRLAEDFGICPDRPVPAAESPRTVRDGTAEEERRCFRALADYLEILRGWKKRYAPASDREVPHPRFLEACRMTEPVTYMIDVLIGGEREMRRALVEDMREDGKIGRLENYLEELHGEDEGK